CGVAGDARFDVGGYQGQVGRGQDPAPGISSRVAAGLQLLQVRDVGEVDLGRQVPAHRGPETLIGPSGPPGSAHSPSNGGAARCQSRTCKLSRRTWRTTASTSWRNRSPGSDGPPSGWSSGTFAW